MKQYFISTAFLATAAILSPAVLADPAAPGTAWSRWNRLTIPLLEQTPTIDGQVSPREWTGAMKLPPLIQRIDGKIDPEPTEVYVFYTNEALHIAWRVHRAWEGPLLLSYDQPGRQDELGLWKDDAVEIFLDPGRTQQEAISFVGNAAGAFADGWVAGDTDVSRSWDWDYAARETEFGWEGELSISFEAMDLDGAPEPGAVWGFDFVRNAKTPSPRVSMLSYRSGWKDMTQYSRLVFGGRVPAVRLLESGAVGEELMGVLAAVVNLTQEPVEVSITYGIYRRKDDVSPMNFLEQVDSGLSAAGGEVAANATPEGQIQELLGFFEPLEHRRVQVSVPAGARMPLNLTAAQTPVGEYLIAYRFTNAYGKTLAAGLIPATRWNPLYVEITPYFLGPDVLAAAASIHSQQLRSALADVRFQLVQGDQVVVEQRVEPDAATAGVDLSTANIEVGPYQLRVQGFGAHGQVVAQTRHDLRRPEPPFWVTQTHGEKAFVPEPWTPVEADSDSVTVWGRTYSFGNGFIPVQMTATGEPLFAAAPRLVLEIDGQEVVLEGSRRLTQTTPEYAEYEWTGTAGSVPVKATTRIEFDGFVTVDLDLETKGVTVDRFFVEFPLTPAAAQLYTLGYFADERRGTDVSDLLGDIRRAGAVGEGFTIGFNHVVWIGNEQRGLEWCAETNQHWSNQDRARAMQLVPESDATLLRLRVIDKPLQAEHLRYRWGLLATPVRPYPDRPHPFFTQGGYPADFPANPETVDTVSENLALARDLGAQWYNVWSSWSREYFFGQPILFDPEAIAARRAFADLIHEHDMKATFYTGWNSLHPDMPMYPFYGEAMQRMPTRFTHGGYDGCPRGGYEDYLANGVVWMIEHFDTDGIYLDGTATPVACHDPHHHDGRHHCGYIDRQSGQPVVTRAIWATRAMFKRLYKIFHGEMRENGLIYSHAGGAPWAVHGFVDVYHSAEAGTWETYTDLPAYRAQYNPQQYGVPGEHTLPRGTDPPPLNLAWGVAMLHDNLLKIYPQMLRYDSFHQSTYAPDKGIGWRMWAPRKWFQWGEHQWHPYYGNEDVLSVESESDEVYASFHVNPEGQVLFYAMNLSDRDQDAAFALDLDALGLPAELHARDAVTNETFEIRDGRFSLEILGERPRVLMIDVDPISQEEVDMPQK